MSLQLTMRLTYLSPICDLIMLCYVMYFNKIFLSIYNKIYDLCVNVRVNLSLRINNRVNTNNKRI